MTYCEKLGSAQAQGQSPIRSASIQYGCAADADSRLLPSAVRCDKWAAVRSTSRTPSSVLSFHGNSEHQGPAHLRRTSYNEPKHRTRHDSTVVSALSGPRARPRPPYPTRRAGLKASRISSVNKLTLEDSACLQVDEECRAPAEQRVLPGRHVCDSRPVTSRHSRLPTAPCADIRANIVPPNTKKDEKVLGKARG